MKGSRFIDGVLTSQDNLTNIDQSKTEAIKERLGSITEYGIVSDSAASPLNLTVTGGGTTLTTATGECYTEFDKGNVDAGYAGTGERIYVSAANIVDRKDASQPAYIYIIYVEVHTNRKTDDLNTQHYTKKLDSFILTQLTETQSDALAVSPYYITVTDIHVTTPTIIALSDNELTDTFGSGNWEWVSSKLYVNITITNYNSVYLGRVATNDAIEDLDSRPIFRINSSIVDTTTIANIVQSDVGLHRKNQHSTGIIGNKDALNCRVDASAGSPGIIRINDLATGEYAYINGTKLESGVLSLLERTIDGGTLAALSTHYIYVQFNYTTAEFSIETSTAYPVNTSTLYKLVLCSVYKNNSNDISAFDGDPRYNETISGTANPVTDLRTFGTLETDKISDTAKSEICGDNLITNGNFEEGITGDVPKGWGVAGSLLNNITFLGGQQSLKLTGSSALAISNSIPYNKLATYSLSVAAKASGTSTLHVYLRGYVDKDIIDINLNDAGTTPQYNIAHSTNKPISTTSNVGTSWAELRGDFDNAWFDDSGGALSPLADYIKYVRVVVRNTSATDVYVDNVKLIDKNGVTATSAELNILDGVTATAAELNYVNGVTSSIQTQLNSTSSSVSTHISDATVHLTSTQNTLLDGVTATFAQINAVANNSGVDIGSTYHKHDSLYIGEWGTWSGGTYVSGTIVQASSDGFVVGISNLNGGTSTTISGETDSNNPPTTARQSNYSANLGSSISMPVKKNDFYRITNSAGDSLTVYFIPLS